MCRTIRHASRISNIKLMQNPTNSVFSSLEVNVNSLYCERSLIYQGTEFNDLNGRVQVLRINKLDIFEVHLDDCWAI
jgi:hypothetical protein